MSENQSTQKIRIDKWLWYTRILKSRTLAAKLADSRQIRINKDKITSSSQKIKSGDVLTFMLHDQLRIIKVVELGKRRGPASEAITLYEDLSPPPPAKDSTEAYQKNAPSPERRPTKHERRDIQKLKFENR